MITTNINIFGHCKLSACVFPGLFWIVRGSGMKT